jgi:hypothetical protein
MKPDIVISIEEVEKSFNHGKIAAVKNICA